MDWKRLSPAFRIMVMYLFAGGLWIIWTDWLLSLWISDMDIMRTAQTHKGWLFVVATAIMLFFLIKSSIKEAEATRTEYTLKLQASERQLSTLMANLPGMVFRCCNDKHWTMLYISEGCYDLTGYSTEEIIRKKITNYARIIHPADRRMVFNLVDKNLESKEHYKLTYRIITKTGQVKWVNEHAVGVFDEHNQLIYIEGLVNDITSQIESELKVKKSLEELGRVNKELDHFTTSVSHDLRSPLLTIEGFVDLLEQDLHDDNIAGAQKSIKRIRSTIDKMHQLLEDLLKLSRLGKIVNPFVVIDMNELMKEVIDYLHGVISRQDCDITVEPDMPFVYVDRSRVSVVLQNLIENAIKFRSPDKRLEILIGFRNSSDFPVFFVRDNGIGIEQSHHEHIFGLFNKLDRNVEGTGIGLSLVERIIKFHGGRIWVESSGKGQGATFFFSLPAMKSET